MRSFLIRSLCVAAGLGMVSGCKTCCPRPACGPAPVMQPPPGVPAAPLPPVPPAPPGGTFLPPEPPAPPAPPAPANLGAPATSGFSPMPSAPRDDLTWKPSPGLPPQVQLRPPETANSAPPNQGARLYPPQVTESVTPAPQKPAVIEQRNPPPVLPVGIPQFAEVKERVATGRRPLLDGGLDWLQSNGYRTVVNLRRPGEEDAADRKEVEKRGLKYLSVEVSPQTLTRKLLDDFNRLVGDAAGYPLFVYDRDGSLAGGLWYLHLRTAGNATDETARVRAAALGLRDDRDSHREMWQAIRQLLGQMGNPLSSTSAAP